MPRKKNKTAVIYTRVSTKGQVDQTSLGSQLQQAEKLCKSKGLKVIGRFSDPGRSAYGKKDKQISLRKAVKVTCETKSTLVVYDASRLGRSVVRTVRTAQELTDAGAELVMIASPIDTTTAAGRMAFQILVSFAEFYSASLSENIKCANKYHCDKKNGYGHRVMGSQPVGWALSEDKKVLAKHPEEQRIIAEAKSAYKNSSSYQEAVRELTKKGVPTPAKSRGKVNSEWSYSTLRRIITMNS